jgi:hypothetical protein
MKKRAEVATEAWFQLSGEGTKTVSAQVIISSVFSLTRRLPEACLLQARTFRAK